MSLSNKILIGFFGIAFIYLTAVFAEVRLKGTPNIIDDSNSIAQNVDVTGIKYLVLQDMDHDVSVIGSDEARLEVRSISGGLLQTLKYRMSGDTLTLSDFRSEATKTIKISVFVPKAQLKGITVDAAEAVISGLEQERFRISQNTGRVQMSDSRIDHVQLNMSDKSYTGLSSTGLDTLSARIDNSEIQISDPLMLLRGSMKNNSFFRASDIEEIQFKKDGTSRLTLYY